MNKFILSLLLIPILLVGICAVSASSIDGGAEISVVDDGVDWHSDVESLRSSTEPYEKLASILEKPKKDDELASILEKPRKDDKLVSMLEKPKKDDRLACILDDELVASGINEAPGMFGSDRISVNEIIRIDSILENQQRKELLATGIKEAPRILDSDIPEKPEMSIHAFGSIPESSLSSIPDIELLKSVYTPTTNPTLDADY